MEIDLKMNLILSLFIAAVLVCGYSVDNSLAVDYKAIKTISVGTDVGSPITWQVTTYQEDAGKNYPQLQAKICFSHSDTQLPQQCELTEGVEVGRNLEVIQFRDRKKPSRGILLITNSYGIGGGPDYLSLWVYEKDKKYFNNILPAQMYIPALGTYKFFPSFQRKSILIIAAPARLVDYNADLDNPDRETIWSPHYYIIDIYKYESKGFSKIGSFKTKQKYDPEKDEEKVIDSELMRIKALLK